MDGVPLGNEGKDTFARQIFTSNDDLIDRLAGATFVNKFKLPRRSLDLNQLPSPACYGLAEATNFP
jgi:hypothetical protein